MPWGDYELPAKDADEGFYRICGVKGSGKTHLTKLFVLNALKEVRDNPHAKLIVYEPKRQFYSWLRTLGLNKPLRYFMPSDLRSVALNFTADYPDDQGSKTLAHAFHPENGSESQPFWGNSARTIYSQVFDAIKGRIGRFDLRLATLILEREEYTRAILGHDPYLVQAKVLTDQGKGLLNDTGKSLQMTIHSRLADMKVMAAHLAQAAEQEGLFSLREFIEDPDQGVLVVSKDATYGLIQDPMNAVLFWRLIQLLDAQQEDEQRKFFIVIDEFPTLAGDLPCRGITDMFLRLRDRGVTVLITYQAFTTLKRVYGENASEIVGQCTNVIYLRQADVESARYAADDLGWERGYEETPPSWQHGPSGSTFSSHQQAIDRPIFPHTTLTRIPPARPTIGLSGIVLTAEYIEGETRPERYFPEESEKPRRFHYKPEFVDEEIPRPDKSIKQYDQRDPRYKVDDARYFERVRETQRVQELQPWELSLLGLPANDQAISHEGGPRPCPEAHLPD